MSYISAILPSPSASSCKGLAVLRLTSSLIRTTYSWIRSRGRQWLLNDDGTAKRVLAEDLTEMFRPGFALKAIIGEMVRMAFCKCFPLRLAPYNNFIVSILTPSSIVFSNTFVASLTASTYYRKSEVKSWSRRFY